MVDIRVYWAKNRFKLKIPFVIGEWDLYIIKK